MGTNLEVCVFRLGLDLGFMELNLKEESKIYLIGFTYQLMRICLACFDIKYNF